MTRAKSAKALGSAAEHESARLHVTGEAQFTDDIPLVAGTLHAAPVLSPVAHGRLLGIDTVAALASGGVRAVVTAQDVPGRPILASFDGDEPVLPTDEVVYAGQVVAVVVAETHEQARRAARQVRVRVEQLPPVLTTAEARARGDDVVPPAALRRGDAGAALRRAQHVLRGTLVTPPQEHFYLETQTAYAIPQEQGGWLVISATQHPHAVQMQVAEALGVHDNDVRVVCRRVGGGFGGKETQSGNIAVLASVAAAAVQAPVKLRLHRRDDMLVTGKRHQFVHHYELGFDDDGLITALRVSTELGAGHCADLSGAIRERAMLNSDSCYFVPDIEVEGRCCRTNISSATAFRGFGAPEMVLLTETLVDDVARTLGLDPLDVRRRNFYDGPDDGRGRGTTPYGMTVHDNIGPALVAQLERTSDYRRRRAEIDAWNAGSHGSARGIALVPCKFGIAFTATHLNQAGAVVEMHLDGTVSASHGGIEMGQGLHTKVMQVVADELGVPLDDVRIIASDTAIVPNASATAASCGTDLNGKAAAVAAATVRDRLVELLSLVDGCPPASVRFGDGSVRTPTTTRTMAEVAGLAHEHRVQLWSDGFYATPGLDLDREAMEGRPFRYFVHGAACAEVEVDLETGEHRVLAVDVLEDVGHSVNPAIDEGQVVGGFVQGMGWLTTEELRWDADGVLLTDSGSTYKVPTARDIPARFAVSLWEEPNPQDTVGRSKAVGEPPFVLAISVVEALRDAIASLAPGSRTPVALDLPASPEHVLEAVRRVRSSAATTHAPAGAGRRRSPQPV